MERDPSQGSPTGGANVTEAEALEGMVRQFAYYSNGAYRTGGLSALEDAFDVLGWDDPHEDLSNACDEPGCRDEATCGWPTRPGGTGPNGGYRRTCGKHWQWVAF